MNDDVEVDPGKKILQQTASSSNNIYSSMAKVLMLLARVGSLCLMAIILVWLNGYVTNHNVWYWLLNICIVVFFLHEDFLQILRLLTGLDQMGKL